MGAGGGYQQPMSYGQPYGGGYQQPMGYGQPYGGGKGGQRFPQQGPTGGYITGGGGPAYFNSGQSPYGPFGGPMLRGGAFPRFPRAYDKDPASNSNIGVPAFRDIPEFKALQDARQRQREEIQGLQKAFRQTDQYQDYMKQFDPVPPQLNPFYQDPRGMPSFNPVQKEIQLGASRVPEQMPKLMAYPEMPGMPGMPAKGLPTPAVQPIQLRGGAFYG